jgi:hypothetical protein
MSSQSAKQRRNRKQGAPCLCTSYGHGHDGERCEKPVTGRTRAGRIRKVCDDCSHYSYLHKHGEALAPPFDPLTREPQPPVTRTPGKREQQPPSERPPIPAPRHIPAPPRPAKPAPRPGYRTDRPGIRPDDDDISTVKF